MSRGLQEQTKQLHQRIISMLRKGVDYETIIDEIGCGYSLIDKLARIANLEQRRLSYSAFLDVLNDLTMSTDTYTDIANRHHCTYITVSDIAQIARKKGYNIEPRKRGRPKKRKQNENDTT